jgi:hypothetical protein
MIAHRKDNGFISVQEALKRGISRASLYRLLAPRRQGKRLTPPKVRSKRDFRGRRLISRSDLVRHMRSEDRSLLSPHSR